MASALACAAIIAQFAARARGRCFAHPGSRRRDRRRDCGPRMICVELPDPLNWLNELADRYGGTASGLVVGTAVQYGLALNERKSLTWCGVTTDLPFLGMLGLNALTMGSGMSLFGIHVAVDGGCCRGAWPRCRPTG
jgi:hypothetical protein